MSLQSVMQDVHARLNLPRAMGEPPRIPAPDWSQVLGPAQGHARFQRLRSVLTSVSAGGATSLPRPMAAPRQDPVLTLVQRITNGYTLEEYGRAKAMGYQAYLEEQLDHLSIPDTAVETRLAQHHPTLTQSPKELYDAFSANFTAPYQQLKAATLIRATNSKRQLFERMVEFWSDHFNIEHDKGLEWVLLPEHDRTVIRAHALGSFPALLEACAFSAAMLYYLDNWLNVAGAPQENYARELLELHSLSVFGGYSEADVKEVAKCFTGWTLNGDPTSPDWLRGRFEPSLHTQGQKFALGHVIPGAPSVGQPGQPIVARDAHLVLQILARHPSTANFLARKLIIRFLTPTPPQHLVDEVAATYLDTHGDIKAMLRVILRREHLLWSSPVLGPKFRRPMHYMTSIFRAFDGEVRAANESLSYLGGMGHLPFGFAPPTGFPDTIEDWGSALLPRWTFASILMRPFFGTFPGVSFLSYPELQAFLGIATPSDRPGLARRINERVLGYTLPPHEEEVLQGYIDGYPAAFDIHALFDCLCLAVSLPGFQWY